MQRDSLSPIALTALFAVAYAILVLAISIAPVNMQLAHYYPDAADKLWIDSGIRLVTRIAFAAAGCFAALAITGRLAPRLTANLLAPVAVLAGALAGCIEVVGRRMIVKTLIDLYRSSPISAWLVGALLTFVISMLIGLLISSRITPERAALDTPLA